MKSLKALLILSCLSISTAQATPDTPKLQNQTVTSGITHQYNGPWEYFVGGGIATFDCNQDRKPDVFLAGGKNPAQLFINQSKTGGSLSFSQQSMGIAERDLKKVLGAYPLDMNNDGVLDLVLLRVGRNILLRGEGNCQFSKVNKAWQFEGGKAWSTAFSAQFEGDALFPTLAFGNYVDRSAPGSPWGTCADNELLRPVSAPQFREGKQQGQATDKAARAVAKLAKTTPDYSQPTALSPGYCALSMLFTDWNKTGEAALRVSNDRHYYRGGEEQLWHVPAGRPPRLYSRYDGWERVLVWGMGIAEGDLNGDGYPEYALTSMGDTRLQILDDEAEEDRPVYRDIAFERGATAHRPYTGEDLRPSTGWHAEFADVNNDARLDLYIAKGNVESMPDFTTFDPDNLLLGQFDQRFKEVGLEAGIALDRRGRGAALADFNSDGLLDLMVVNRAAPVEVFVNRGAITDWGVRPMGNWLQLEVSQSGNNRFAVGATISVKTGNLTQIRKIQVGGGHASGRLGFVHIGLGVAERAQVRIKWPDGSWSAPYRLFANQFALIEKGSDQVRYWYPEVGE